MVVVRRIQHPPFLGIYPNLQSSLLNLCTHVDTPAVTTRPRGLGSDACDTPLLVGVGDGQSHEFQIAWMRCGIISLVLHCYETHQRIVLLSFRLQKRSPSSCTTSKLVLCALQLIQDLMVCFIFIPVIFLTASTNLTLHDPLELHPRSPSNTYHSPRTTNPFVATGCTSSSKQHLP